MHRTSDESGPVRGGATAGTRMIRPARGELAATGTFACPRCDAPGHLHRPFSPSEAYSCGFCAHEAPARDFVTLGDPVRPARVVVRVGLPVAAAGTRSA